MRFTSQTIGLLFLASLGWATIARAGTATSVAGLYFTGVNNSGTALGDNSQDSHWSVTYARVGGSTTNTAYTGSAYVVDSGYVDGAWVANSSTYRWITAPGASTSGSGTNTNQGGDYLPGNGTSGTNSGYYVYRLQFTINGSGGTGSAVTNNIQLSMTIAADDGYAVYVNPASSPTVSSTGVISAGGTAAVATGTNAWNNTSSFAIGNGTAYGVDNADFVIGTNTIYIVVSNTNSQTGTNSSTALNPSGLLVYQVGSGISIDGKPVPEVGAILPVLGALGLFALRRFRLRPAGAA